MVKLYLRKIQEGIITIEDVPTLWRMKVEDLMGGENNEVNI